MTFDLKLTLFDLSTGTATYPCLCLDLNKKDE